MRLPLKSSVHFGAVGRSPLTTGLRGTQCILGSTRWPAIAPGRNCPTVAVRPKLGVRLAASRPPDRRPCLRVSEAVEMALLAVRVASSRGTRPLLRDALVVIGTSIWRNREESVGQQAIRCDGFRSFCERFDESDPWCYNVARPSASWEQHHGKDAWGLGHRSILSDSSGSRRWWVLCWANWSTT